MEVDRARCQNDGMIEEPPHPARDAQAWPESALPVSVLAAGAALAVGVTLALRHDRPAAAVTVLVAAVLTGGALIGVGLRYWWTGREAPSLLGLTGVLIMFGGAAGVNILLGSGGFGLVISGMLGGLMLANAVATGYVRRLRAAGQRRPG
jgi:hypothetical protein